MHELRRNLDDVGDLVDQLTDALADAVGEAEYLRSITGDDEEWLALNNVASTLSSAESSLDTIRDEVRYAIADVDFIT